MANENERSSFRDRYRNANQDKRDEVDGFLKSNRGSILVWGALAVIIVGIIVSAVTH